VVPPGEGWTHDPYGGEVVDGKLYGRASAVSKSDFATYTYALRALESLAGAEALEGAVELHFTYDEEFGGELGPGWLLRHRLTHPDLLIAAGFSHQVVTAHNGCLQLEVAVHGRMAHAAIPASGIDALQGAAAILNALYAENDRYRGITGRRDVVFVNPDDLAGRGLREGDRIDVEASRVDGTPNGRAVRGLVAVPYGIARGSVAMYFPEGNGLLALDEHDARSGTPGYKSIPVRLSASSAPVAPEA